MEPDRIDVAALKALDEGWLRQLWAQVYVSFYLPDPQGFRLTDEERARLQKNNEQYSKPLPCETEVLELLHWEAPVDHWNWKKTSDLLSELNLRAANASQLGKVLNKLAMRDERIKIKAPHNVKHYLVPPRWIKDLPADDTPALT